MEDFTAAEERFITWTELLQEADSVACRQAVEEFEELMVTDQVCYYIWSEWAQLYLYGVWSPTRNTTAYGMLLERVMADERLADLDKESLPRLMGILGHNQVGDQAQNFPFYDSEERAGELTDYLGRRVLLMIIDTTCPSCLDIMQEVESCGAIMSAVADGQMELVVISLGVTPEALLPLLMEKRDTPWQIFCSGRSTLEAAYYDTAAAPFMLLLGPDGRVEAEMTRDTKNILEKLQ